MCGFGWFGFLNNVFGHGLKDGSGSLFVEFQEEKISSKCFISLLLKEEYVIAYLMTSVKGTLQELTIFHCHLCSPRSNCRERNCPWT